MATIQSLYELVRGVENPKLAPNSLFDLLEDSAHDGALTEEIPQIRLRNIAGRPALCRQADGAWHPTLVLDGAGETRRFRQHAVVLTPDRDPVAVRRLSMANVSIAAFPADDAPDRLLAATMSFARLAADVVEAYGYTGDLVFMADAMRKMPTVQKVVKDIESARSEFERRFVLPTPGRAMKHSSPARFEGLR